tara:strand:- start:20637 stop:21038 length:402 start_codon:yes stop_codon:yes gene_type:complete
MLLLLLMVGSVAAGGLPEKPTMLETVPGECIAAIPIRQGAQFPDALLMPDALARCSAVAEVPSRYAYLLKMEDYANTVAELYEIDTNKLETERDHYRRLAKTPIQRQPWFVATATAALVTGVLVAYSYGTESE